MQPNELFAHSDYKAILQNRQKLAVRSKPHLTWKGIAKKLRIQPTYISRAFHHDNVHLGEDHLFELMELLQFESLAKEYVLLLRAKSVSSSALRRGEIQRRIDTMMRENFVRVDTVKKQATLEETEFLMNPMLMLIYVALDVKRYARSTSLLQNVFGLTDAQLLTHLQQLVKLELITLKDQSGASVVEVRRNTMHFAKEHPLMRGHQQILRHLSAARLARVNEPDKVSFKATFSTSAQGFNKIKEEFYNFLQTAQKIAANHEHERVYQMDFDLFPWDEGAN